MVEARASGTLRAWSERGGEVVELAVSGPWILLIAWFVPDPDATGNGRTGKSYRDDPDHFLVRVLPELSEAGIDVVFAAGNCGDPCPDGRRRDRRPAACRNSPQ